MRCFGIIGSMKTTVDKVKRTILVGTHRGDQLGDWCGWHNYPVRGGEQRLGNGGDQRLGNAGDQRLGNGGERRLGNCEWRYSRKCIVRNRLCGRLRGVLKAGSEKIIGGPSSFFQKLRNEVCNLAGSHV